MKKTILLSYIAVGLINSASAALVAEWKLNGNANDTSGNGYHGVVHGSATFVLGGLSITGNASEYYQGGGYVSLPSLTGAFDNNVTLNIWAKGEVTPVFSSEKYFAFGDFWGAKNTLWMGIAGNDINVGYNDTGNNYQQISINKSADFYNNWHMITLTMTPTTLSGYLNGSLFGSVNGSFVSPDTSYLNAIGSHYWWGGIGQSARLTATLSEASIYNNALSSSDVSALYATQSQNFGSIPEPSSYALLAAGAIGMLTTRRRKTT